MRASEHGLIPRPRARRRVCPIRCLGRCAPTIAPVSN